MKKKLTKRVSLFCPWTHDEIILSTEFNPALTDYDILCSLYCPELHEWIFDELWAKTSYKGTDFKVPQYRFEVWEHIEYQEQWFDRLIRKLYNRLTIKCTKDSP
jgi:hypothetical protein